MTTSSPADLAVAFRSLPRRLEQAPNDDTPTPAIAAAAAAVHDAIVSAATLLGSAATAESVAVAIEHRHLPDWDDVDLTTLQATAIRAAQAIRDLEDTGR
ncbi:MAG: hypothetical protein ABIR32_01640 [Ilumatobacteraceae bacterium]